MATSAMLSGRRTSRRDKPARQALLPDVSQDLVSGVIRLLHQDTIFAEPTEHPQAKLKDKDDLVILAAAISACGDILVTGDKALQSLK